KIPAPLRVERLDVRDLPGQLAEPDRLVERLRDRIVFVASARDDRFLGARVAQPLQRKQVHRTGEAASAVAGVRPDGLQLAEREVRIEPRESGGDELARGARDD